MKELYLSPEVGVITFATTDVITTSEPVTNEVPELPFDEL